jgi:hypothetical protein
MPSAKGLRESPARNQGSPTIPLPLTTTEPIPDPMPDPNPLTPPNLRQKTIQKPTLQKNLPL